jgi:hypothetical protein
MLILMAEEWMQKAKEIRRHQGPGPSSGSLQVGQLWRLLWLLLLSCGGVAEGHQRLSMNSLTLSTSPINQSKRPDVATFSIGSST